MEGRSVGEGRALYITENEIHGPLGLLVQSARDRQPEPEKFPNLVRTLLDWDVFGHSRRLRSSNAGVSQASRLSRRRTSTSRGQNCGLGEKVNPSFSVVSAESLALISRFSRYGHVSLRS